MPITLRSHTDTSGSGGLAIGEFLIDLTDVPTYDPFVRTGDMSFPLPINQWAGLNQQLNEQILEVYNATLDVLGVIPVISDIAYDATTWNGNLNGASKNAIRDKFESVVASIPTISDTAYNATSWNGNLDGATKNVIRDKFETLGSMSTQDAGSVAITGGIIGNLTALTGSQINSNDLLQNAFGGSVGVGNHNFFGNESLVILDTDSLQYLTIKPGSNLSADRVFTLVTGDADRTLTLAGNATISNTNSGDQTSIVGISGTKAEFNTANSDGDFVFTSDIGSTVQAYDADLATIASLTATTDNFIVSVASSWASRTPAQVRTTLGLVIGTNVQAYDADLTTWAGLTPSANAQSLVTAADYSAMRTLLSLVPGTNVQAYDAELAALAGLTSAANKLPYFTGSGTAALADFTPAGFSLTLSANASIGGTHSGTSSGSNTGDQTITLTGDVTGSGTGSFAATIANNAVTLAKMATMATASILGRNTAGTGNVEVLSASTTRSLLGLVIGTNVQAWDTELDSLAGLGVIQGDLIYGSAANTYSKLAKDANATRYLSNQGTSNNPSWNQVNLANGVTGTLPVANGGTGAAAFTLGSIVFAGTSGVYTQDNSNFFWDDTNNRLGIGTAAPTSRVQIAQGILQITNTGNYGTYAPTTGEGFELGYDFNLNHIGAAGSGVAVFQSYNRTGAAWRDVWFRGNNITFSANATNVLTLLASNSSAGIGTTAPSAKLHIISTTEQLRAGYDVSNYFNATVGSTGGVTFDAVGSGALFTFSDPVVTRRKWRVYSNTSIATLTPEIDTYDVFVLTAQAVALNIANPSTSTPSEGEQVRIRITDNGTARAITYGTKFVAKGGVALPTTTVLSKRMEMIFEYDSVLTEWVLMSVAQQA